MITPQAMVRNLLDDIAVFRELRKGPKWPCQIQEYTGLTGERVAYSLGRLFKAQMAKPTNENYRAWEMMR